GSFGSLFGTLVSRVFPSAHISPGAFALVAMAATFGSATRATFMSIVFMFELTRDYEIILPLMLATVIADLVASALLRESLMTEKLARRGLRVSRDYHADPLGTTPVLEADHLVGICTRTDILRSRTRQFEHERAQQGWRPRFRSSSRTTKPINP